MSKRRKKRKGCLRMLLVVVSCMILIFVVFGVWAYRQVKQTTENVYSERPSEQIVVRKEEIQIEKKQPFSLLVLGIDTGEFGREDKGRSDVMMVVTVNANTNRVTMTSIPRDIRTEIVGYDIQDKINHAYAFGGVAMSVNTVQKMLNIPIDYTLSVDMSGFEKVVDTVGGVTITPESTFEIGGYTFVEGQEMHMDGRMALEYSRERYTSGGDYGRQSRQRQLIQSLLQSVLDIKNILSFGSIVSSLEGIVTTDMTLSDMMTILQDYHQAAGNIEMYQIEGTGDMIDGVYYDIPSSQSLEQATNRIRYELEL